MSPREKTGRQYDDMLHEQARRSLENADVASLRALREHYRARRLELSEAVVAAQKHLHGHDRLAARLEDLIERKERFS